jgi:hypothetical protein
VVYAEGVELFVYNRTPAYDAIVERMKKHEKQAEENSHGSSTTLDKPSSNDDGLARKNGLLNTKSQSSGDSSIEQPVPDISGLPSWLRLLMRELTKCPRYAKYGS